MVVTIEKAAEQAVLIVQKHGPAGIKLSNAFRPDTFNVEFKQDLGWALDATLEVRFLIDWERGNEKHYPAEAKVMIRYSTTGSQGIQHALIKGKLLMDLAIVGALVESYLAELEIVWERPTKA